MQLSLLIILLCLSIIQTFDYDIDNQQICTHRPFIANFHHNCSRTRLIQNVSVPNTDQVLYISFIFTTTDVNTSLTITKSAEYNQKIYLLFFTFTGRYVHINNNTMLTLNDTSISTYLYDTLLEQFSPTMSAYFTSSVAVFTNPYCLLKDTRLLPSQEISRVYYLYTNKTEIYIDLSTSSYRISPLFDGFATCFAIQSNLGPLAIGLIVGVSVLSFATTVLVAFCLKKQLIELYHIWKNFVRQKLGLTPTNIIDN
jgi:hypothetical protein